MNKNKKGEGNTGWIIIGLLLALAVLVLLVVALTGGWSKFWGGVSGYFSSTNVDSMKDTCKLLCTTGSYDYCNSEKVVNYIDDQKDKKRVVATCETLGKQWQRLGFEDCQAVTCPVKS